MIYNLKEYIVIHNCIIQGETTHSEQVHVKSEMTLYI